MYVLIICFRSNTLITYTSCMTSFLGVGKFKLILFFFQNVLFVFLYIILTSLNNENKRFDDLYMRKERFGGNVKNENETICG